MPDNKQPDPTSPASKGSEIKDLPKSEHDLDAKEAAQKQAKWQQVAIEAALGWLRHGLPFSTVLAHYFVQHLPLVSHRDAVLLAKLAKRSSRFRSLTTPLAVWT